MEPRGIWGWAGVGKAVTPAGSHTGILEGMRLRVTLCLVWLCGQTVAADPHSLQPALPRTLPKQSQSQHHTECQCPAQWSVSSFQFILAGHSGAVLLHVYMD